MSPIPAADKQILSSTELADARLRDWQLVDGRLCARFATGTFAVGRALVDEIADEAERADHHPDVDLRYTHLQVAMISHDVAGITRRDVRLAQAISRIAGELEVSAQQVEPSDPAEPAAAPAARPAGWDIDVEPDLVQSILTARPVSEFVRDPDLLRAIELALAPLRESDGATVAWWGVNESRVDIAVRTATDEWRIVYGTEDGEWIDWLSAFRRPPAFQGVTGGCAVIVNGPSGAGKSTLLDAIRRRSVKPWVAFDEPVLGSVDDPYLIWRDQAPVLHRGFLSGIAALARTGNCVAVAAAGHPASLFQQTFGDIRTLRVGLDCDLATLEAREGGRDGRWGGLAASSVGVHDGWQYDLRFDTTIHRPDDMADEVLRALNDR